VTDERDTPEDGSLEEDLPASRDIAAARDAGDAREAAGPEPSAARASDSGVPADNGVPAERSAEITAIVEALIFASPDPLTFKALCRLLDAEPKEDVQAALDAVRQHYERPGGLQFVEVAGGYQIVTRPDLNDWVRRLFHERSAQKLSVQSLETLAVIAYRQPVTALEITEIRGVNASGVLTTLLERRLIKIAGRKQVVGRPFMYATTKEFLIRFGLNDLSDLPKVEDMADAMGLDSPLLVERTPIEEQLPLGDASAGDRIRETDDSGGSVH
jgi:segregation and condensation protein B